jgi:undecaprenyl-diphosphatase
MNNLPVTFMASVLVWILFGGLFVLWFIDGRIKKEQVVHALFSTSTAWVIAMLVKNLFPTIRPFLQRGVEVYTLTTPNDGAFPSAHTTMAFALSVTIFLHDRKVGWFYILAAVLIGVSRVMANVHYPIDILGGALLGTLVAVAVEKTHFFKLKA